MVVRLHLAVGLLLRPLVAEAVLYVKHGAELRERLIHEGMLARIGAYQPMPPLVGHLVSHHEVEHRALHLVQRARAGTGSACAAARHGSRPAEQPSAAAAAQQTAEHAHGPRRRRPEL